MRPCDVRRCGAKQLREVQTELAHANRVATMGQLTASIAHELKHALAAARTDAGAALRWLDKTPPDLAEVRDALAGILSAACLPPRRPGVRLHQLRGQAAQSVANTKARRSATISNCQGPRT